MNNLEKKLSQLPKPRMRKRADLKIRFKLYSLLWQKKLAGLRAVLNLKQVRLAPVLAVAVMTCMLVIVPGYAYASSSVTLGHLLYPVKLGLEKAELSLSRSSLAKVKTYEKFVERRLDEASILSQDNKEAKLELIETINKALFYSRLALGEAEQVNKGERAQEVREIIENAQSRQVNSLAGVAQTVGIEVEDDVLDNIALALDNIKTQQAEVDQGRRGHNHLPGAESRQGATTDAGEEDIVAYSESEDKSTTSAPASIINKRVAIQRALNKTRESISGLKESLPNEEFAPDDVSVLFNRLDRKVEQAEKALENENLGQLDGMLKATQALTNNARHFIKPQHEKFNQGRGKSSQGNSHKFNNQTEGQQASQEQDKQGPGYMKNNRNKGN